MNSNLLSQNGHIKGYMGYIFNLNSTLTFYGKLYFEMFTVRE